MVWLEFAMALVAIGGRSLPMHGETLADTPDMSATTMTYVLYVYG